MKNLLLLGLTAVFAGNALAIVPQQPLFSDRFIHQPEEIDTDKLAKIGDGKKFDFCREMIELYNQDTGELSIYKTNDIMIKWNIPADPITLAAFELRSCMTMLYAKIKKDVVGINEPSHITESAVKQLVNTHFKSSDDEIQKFDNAVVIEILKERKNNLVQEMRDAFMKEIHANSLGDIATEDYSMFASAGAFIFYMGTREASSLAGAQIGGILQGVGFSMAVVNLFWLSKYRAALRGAEKEMRKIDVIIEKIKAF